MCIAFDFSMLKWEVILRKSPYGKVEYLMEEFFYLPLEFQQHFSLQLHKRISFNKFGMHVCLKPILIISDFAIIFCTLV